MKHCRVIDSIRKSKMMYKANSKVNCNYLNQIPFLFANISLMKLKLNARKLRLLSIIFENLFEKYWRENDEMKLNAKV